MVVGEQLMSKNRLLRKWEREEVVILVVEYFRAKHLSSEEIEISHWQVSNFLRKREEILTKKSVSDEFRDYAGIRMQWGKVRCLDPDTKYNGMHGSRLQREIVTEYLANPHKLIQEARHIYRKYNAIE